MSAFEQAGDGGLRLVLSSQSQDNFFVSTSSLMSLLCSMRSSAIAASLEPRVESSVLKSACCAAASLLTPSNASTYRTLLVHFGDDPVACTFVIFALGKHNIIQHTFCFRSSYWFFFFFGLCFLQVVKFSKDPAQLRKMIQTRSCRFVDVQIMTFCTATH